MNKPNPLEAYFDGSCPLCSEFAQRVVKDKGELVQMHDARTAVLPEGVKRSEALSEMYVRGTDGRLHTNADAVLEILGSYPLLQPLVWFGRLPLVRDVLRALYSDVARNRMAISRVLKSSSLERRR